MSNDDTLPLDLTDQDDRPFDVELVIRPTPDKLSQLENDMEFITDEQVQEEIQTESVIINARIDDEVNTLNSAIESEATTRADNDNTLQGNINTVAGDLSLEETARINADTTLQGNIDTLSGTVTSNYNTLDGKITDEATARGNADTTLQNNIDTLSGTVISNYNTLDGKISNNKTSIDNHIADKTNPHEVTKSQVGLGNVDNTSDLDKPISTATQTALDGKVDKLSTKPTAGTYTKVDINAEGQVTSGTTLQASDIPSLNLTKISDVTTTTNELNQLHEAGAVKSDFEKLHAITATSDELNTLDGITASTSELNILDGATLTTAELNTLDGITATTTELNCVDGVTSPIQTQLDSKVDENAAITGATKCKITYDSKGLVTGGADLQQSDIPALNLSKISDVTATPSEVNILDGATVSTAELNVLDGITASTTELNYVDGVTSSIQTQINSKQANITSTNMLSSDLVDDSNKTHKFATSAQLTQIATNQSDISTINGKIPSQATSSNQLADKNFVNSTVSTNTANFIGTFNSVADLNAYSGTVTNNDYAFVVTTDSLGNSAYDRYKYTTATTPASWVFEYELNNSSFTSDQWAAINSGATTTNIGQIATNTSNITSLQNNKQDNLTAGTNIAINNNVISATDTTYSIATGSANGTISVAVDGGTASDVAVKGLGSAAYTPSTDYATASQGSKADTAIQSVTTGSANGTISVDGSDVSVYGLGSAAYTQSSAYATSTQGGKADSAIQTVKVNNTALTPDSSKAVDITVPTKISNLTDDTATYPVDKADTLTGLTSTVSELNILDGVTASASELNILDGATLTTTELNYVDGVTSNIQTQLNAKLTTSDIVSSVSGSSTNLKAVGAKLFYDTCGDIETLINAL